MTVTSAVPAKRGCATARQPKLKALSVVLSLIGILVVGVLLATFITPRLIGGSPLAIQTSVMAPTLQPGDLAVVQPVTPDALMLGDVVAFYTYYEYLVAQRIVELLPGHDGSTASLVTRVDNYYDEYSRVAATAIKGRIVFSLPLLGHVATAPLALWGSLGVAALFGAATWHRLSITMR